MAAQQMHHKLGAVADTQYRDAQIKHLCADGRSPIFIGAVGSACKDNSPRSLRFYNIQRFRIRNDFAGHMALAHAPRDQLIVLAAKIDDDH